MDKKVVKWTEEQEKVLDSKDKNLIVSASAGSGKTTVMIEKIIRLMTQKKVPISNFLVVTFTNASASDMRRKLTQKLLEREPDEFLLEQISKVSSSDISTLHVFCSKLISTYFYEASVEPNFSVIDDKQSSLLKDRILTNLFEEKERKVDEDYFELFEIFQSKRSDKNLRRAILRFDNFLKALVSGEKWFNETIKSSYSGDLSKNKCAVIINNYVSGVCSDVAREAEELETLCLNFNEQKAYEFLVEISSKFKTIKFSNSYFVNAKNLFEISIYGNAKFEGKNEDLILKVNNFIVDTKDLLKDLKSNMISADEKTLLMGVVQAKKHIEMLYNLTKEFEESYQNLKREMGVLDFNDLEKYALIILDNNAIKKAVQEKYKYVFVDEYQDINEVQEEIIKRVSFSNNRFMVGDVKQSIYAFRLCNPDIFIKTYNDYKTSKDAEALKLNTNFRSDKKILSFVDRVFSGVMTEKFGSIDYANEAKFIAGESNLDNEKSINLLYIDAKGKNNEKPLAKGVYSVKNHEEQESEETSKIIAEANLVAGKIAELVNPKNPSHYNYQDIAILISSRNEKISKFTEILSSYNIPLSSSEKYDLIEKTYIQEIINFTKLSVSANDDILLFKVLKSKMFDFSDEELVSIRKLNMSLKFYECVALAENLSDEKLNKKLEFFKEKLNKFSRIAKLVLVQDFVNMVIDEFNLDEIYLSGVDGENAYNDIKRFVISLPNVSVSSFVIDYQNYMLEIEKSSGGDAVQMMTIHASKGIEFKVVFYINTSNNINLKSTYGSLLFSEELGAGIDFFDLENRTKQTSIPMSAIRLTQKRRLVEEQQRVLYVGLTRAIEKLFVVCTKDSNKLFEKFPDYPKAYINWFEPIITEELSGKHDKNINFENYILEDLLFVPKSEKRELLLTAKSDGQEPFKYNFNASTLVPLKTSASKLMTEKLTGEDENEDYENSFFDEENTLKNNSSAKRGTAYHKVFQNIEFQNKNFDEQLELILNEKLTDSERQLVDKNVILKVLALPFFNQIKTDDKVIKEREFYAKINAKQIFEGADNSDNFILQGVIDLLVLNEKELILLDYKTGKITDEKIKKYSFQLNLYADVTQKALQKQVTKKLLCFIDCQKLIEI